MVKFLDSPAWMREWFEAWLSDYCAPVGYGRILSEFGFEHSDRTESEGCIDTDVSNDSPAPSFKGVKQDYRLALHRSLALYVTGDKDPYRVWADYFFDCSNFRRFILYVADLRYKGAFGSFQDRIYILACRRPETPTPFPFEICGAFSPPLKFGVGLVPQADPRALEQVPGAMKICLDKCLELEGRPYLYG